MPGLLVRSHATEETNLVFRLPSALSVWETSGRPCYLIYCLQRLGVHNTVEYAGPPNEYRVYVGTSLEWNIHGNVKSRYTCAASIAIVRW